MIGLCIQIVRRHQYRQRLTFFSKNTNIFLIVGFLGCLLYAQNSEYKTSGQLSPCIIGRQPTRLNLIIILCGCIICLRRSNAAYPRRRLSVCSRPVSVVPIGYCRICAGTAFAYPDACAFRWSYKGCRAKWQVQN